MFDHRLKKSVGMMLIELMVGLTLSFIVLSALFEIYLNYIKSYQLQSALSEIQYNAKAVIAVLTADLQVAEQVVASGKLTVSHADQVNEYTVEKTKRKNSDGSPVYALFKRDIKKQKIKIANNVSNMLMRFTVYRNGEWLDLAANEVGDWSSVAGVAMEFDVTAYSIRKHWYHYIALPEQVNE